MRRGSANRSRYQHQAFAAIGGVSRIIQSVRVKNQMDVEFSQIEWDDFDLGPSLEFAGANYYAQFMAARALLSVHDQWSQTSSEKLHDFRRRTFQTDGDEREWMVEAHIELIHQSMYEDAARSMAAVGMLAPLIESLFKQLSSVLNREWPRRGYVVDIITRLVKAEEITAMPDNLEPALRALFEYRNNMFHLGFEWPTSDRTAFAKRIDDANWPVAWFDRAMDGEEAWIFYLSPSFISHCLGLVDEVMAVVRSFLIGRGYDVW